MIMSVMKINAFKCSSDIVDWQLSLNLMNSETSFGSYVGSYGKVWE